VLPYRTCIVMVQQQLESPSPQHRTQNLEPRTSNLGPPGQTHLIFISEQMNDITVFPAGFMPFAFEAGFCGFIVFKQVEGHSGNEGKVFCGMACSFLTSIFGEHHLQAPVQVIFYAPVLSDVAVKSSGVCLQAADVVAGFFWYSPVALWVLSAVISMRI
jgi:hypothetical protein